MKVGLPALEPLPLCLCLTLMEIKGRDVAAAG